MNKKYLRYTIYSIKAGMAEITIWAALSSFVLLGRSGLGIENINIMETCMFIVPIIGTWLAFNKIYKISLRNLIITMIITDTIFLSTILYMLCKNIQYGMAIYIIMLIGILCRPIKKERMRKFEDMNLKDIRYKSILERIREKASYSESLAGIVGACITLVLINILNVELITLAIYLIVLNIIQNMFDYYAWIKYFR